MNKLIKFQLRNIFTSKYFYVLAFLTLLFSTGVLSLSIDDPYYFPRIPWLEKVISILKGDMSFLIMIFICMFNCYDFSNKTLKNIIGRGYTKKEYIISKYIASIISVFAIYGILVLYFAYKLLPYGVGYNSTFILVLVNYLFKVIAYIILYSTIALVVSKTSLAIIICIFSKILLSMIVSFFKYRLHIDITKILLSTVSVKYFKTPTIDNLIITIALYLLHILVYYIVTKSVLTTKEAK